MNHLPILVKEVAKVFSLAGLPNINPQQEAVWLLDWASKLQSNSSPTISYSPAPRFLQMPASSSSEDQQLIETLNSAIYRRIIKREPLQYILGSAGFHAIPFPLKVTPDVLIPRFETEHLVDLIVDRQPRHSRKILDVGTGSGAIAIALSIALPDASVYATDISRNALEVARHNIDQLSVNSCPGQGVTLLPPAHLLTYAIDHQQQYDTIVANLPYISNGEYDSLQHEVRLWEPRSALCPPSRIDDDSEGLGLILELLHQAPRVFCHKVWLEHGVSDTLIPKLSTHQGYTKSFEDLTGKKRFSLFEFG